MQINDAKIKYLDPSWLLRHWNEARSGRSLSGLTTQPCTITITNSKIVFHDRECLLDVIWMKKARMNIIHITICTNVQCTHDKIYATKHSVHHGSSLYNKYLSLHIINQLYLQYAFSLSNRFLVAHTYSIQLVANTRRELILEEL